VEQIFRSNVRRLREAEAQQSRVSGEPELDVREEEVMRFARDHCAKHPKCKGAWNGRQIRNAFLVAASLARHEAEEKQQKLEEKKKKEEKKEKEKAKDKTSAEAAAGEVAAAEGSKTTAAAATTMVRPALKYSHFKEVEKLTREFARFRAHVLGGDDSRKAKENEERDDDFDDDSDTLPFYV
jgi:hypothetical protein